MTDNQKLEFLIRAIVLAGGPKQTNVMTDELYLAEVSRWLLWAVRPVPFIPKYHSERIIAEIEKSHCSCRENKTTR